MPYKDLEKRRIAARAALKRFRARHPPTPEQRERSRTQSRARYLEKRDDILRRRREAYVGDRAELIRARNREWSRRNKEARKAYRRTYFEAHKEQIRARDRERERKKYAKNPRAVLDYYRTWRQRNLAKAREYLRVSTQRRRAASTGRHFTVLEWLALVERYAGRCAYCGAAGPLEADHRIPLSRGGTNDIDNILPACRTCNRRKHARTEAEFREILTSEARAMKQERVSPSESRSGHAERRGPDQTACRGHASR